MSPQISSVKSLFIINDSLANKISYFHLMLLMASLPFDMFYSHIILISLAVHSLIHLDKRDVKPIVSYRTLILQSVFWVTVISTIYTVNMPGAFEQWARHLTILIIPLIFCINPLDLRKYRANLFLIFSIVCTLTIIYLYADALHTTRYYHLPLKSIFWANFTSHNFSLPLNIHATFFSLQLALALVYLLSVLLTADVKYKGFYIACCLVLAAGIMQLSSKSVFAATLIAVNFAVPYFLLQQARRRKFMVIAMSVTVLLAG